MSKRHSALAGFVLLLAFLPTAACKNPTSPPESITEPAVLSVEITPESAELERGWQKEFTAIVEVSGDAARTVKWAVTGKNSLGQTITLKYETNVSPDEGETTVLHVALNESAVLLMLTATATADETKFASAEITIPLPENPIVFSVEISPQNPTVQRGDTLQFSADVSAAGGAGEDVEWSLAGNNSAETSISQSGLLSVASDETAETLTVTAVSIDDRDISNSTTVTVSGDIQLDNIWLVGDMVKTGESWELPGVKMNAEADGTFIWAGDVPANSNFRFNLSSSSLIPVDNWDRNWYAPVEDDAVVVSNGNDYDFEFISGDIGRTWLIELGGYYILTLKPDEGKMNVSRPVIVDSVTIINPPQQLIMGQDYIFSAQVTGKNMELAVLNISWAVSGATDSSFGTGGDSDKLSVSANEGAETLTITASAEGITSDPLSIEVLDPSKISQAAVMLSLDDSGGSLEISGGIPSNIPVIYKTGGLAGEDRIFFSVANPNGSYSYSWYVGGQEKTGNVVTFLASEYNAGTYTVRLTVTINGITWSFDELLYFTVAAVKQ